MIVLPRRNFGLNGQMLYSVYDTENYDNLFGIGKKAKERREERRADRKQRKDEKKADRQEKRETATEKRKLKNELKQTQIDEKKAQLAMLNQQGQQPPASPAEGSDNTLMIVAALVGTIFIAGVGFVMIKKKAPVPMQQIPALQPA